MTAPANNPQVLLEARGIVKTFPGVRALDGVGLKVRAGRLNALLGENGAGKSTLMNILAGVFPPDSGEVLLEGQPVRFRNPRAAQEAGVSIIFQELNLADNLSVAENIFLAREPINRFGMVDYARMRREAATLLERLGLRVDPNRRVSELTVASQQVVEIAKALSFKSRVLILDEPTSALTEQEVQALFRLIDQLKADGVGLVYITHRLEELARVADDVTVLRDGKFIAEKPYAETTRDELVRMMVGRDVIAAAHHGGAAPGEPVLAVDNLTLRNPERPDRPVVDDVSLSVARGEVLGVFGLMGAGRTELLEAIFGLHRRRVTGSVAVDGRATRFRRPADAIRAGVALAPEDRKTGGLVLGMSVAENICLPCLKQVERAGAVLPSLERQVAGKYVDRLAVKTPSLRETARNLSGGNQQKVVLAKWLATGPKVLLLDEPTRGIDVGAKQEIYSLVRELAASGLGVVMVSSELPEVLALSDRILVLCEGRLTGEFSRDAANEESILQAALPKSAARRSA